jgi:hypothetical protein
MRAAIAVLVVLAAAAPAVHAQTASSLAATGTSIPADAWAPLRIFVGTWAGERAEAKGSVKVRREYLPVLNNQHLQVSEEAKGSDAQPWGLISYDAWHHGFVLRHFSADGSALDLPYDASASTDKQLVFASAADAGKPTRVTYQVVNWNEFVERIDNPADQTAANVTETHFKRKH